MRLDFGLGGMWRGSAVGRVLWVLVRAAGPCTAGRHVACCSRLFFRLASDCALDRNVVYRRHGWMALIVARVAIMRLASAACILHRHALLGGHVRFSRLACLMQRHDQRQLLTKAAVQVEDHPDAPCANGSPSPPQPSAPASSRYVPVRAHGNMQESCLCHVVRAEVWNERTLTTSD